MNPKLVPGYCDVGLYVLKASSINRLTTALECVPFFDRVPISLPIMPCSVCQRPPNGAYSIPNSSRCLSRRYSVNERTVQSSMCLALQSFALGKRLFFSLIRYRLHKSHSHNLRRISIYNAILYRHTRYILPIPFPPFSEIPPR